MGEAALRAILAGIDMDMAGGDFGSHIPALVKSGLVPMSRLDDAVRRFDRRPCLDFLDRK